MSTVLVTGASGYLGSKLSSALQRNGHRVVRALRNRDSADPTTIEFELGGRCPSADELRARNIDAVVHCAHDFSALTWEESSARNVAGTIALASAAAGAGVTRQIYISSLSAFPGCISQYGKTKLATEEALEAHGVVILRPGLLYDDAPRGLVGTIKRLSMRLPAVPLIGSGNQPQYTCHVDDLCEFLCRLVESPPVSRSPIFAAHPVSLRFKDIVKELARSAGRPRIILVPVPWRLVWLGLRTLEALRFRFGLRSDSVLGLQFGLREEPQRAGLSLPQFPFRAFQP